MRRHHFTLVEVLLALGVVAIGVCSIMVLFPIGATATRNASMETYAAHSADELLSFLKYYLQDSHPYTAFGSDTAWNYYIKGDDLSSKVDDPDKSWLDKDEKWNYSTPNEDDSTKFAFNDKSGIFVSVSSEEDNRRGIFMLISHRGDNENEPLKEKIKDKKLLEYLKDEGLIDFRAIAKLSRERIKIGTESIGYDYAAALTLELSWPAEASYDKRQKAYYYMEVFKGK